MKYHLVDDAGYGNYYTIVCDDCGMILDGVYDKNLEGLSKEERKNYLDSKVEFHNCAKENVSNE